MKAVDTGRCYVNLNSNTFLVKDFVNPPCYGAMASDLAIHCAPQISGTAGIEAYLSRTPTIFYDPFNNIFSQIKNINESENVFNDWDNLWNVVIKYFFENLPKSKIGNLDYLIKKIDPFNDGKASQRIINYLYDISKISNNNFSNEKILDISAENYAKKWGSDKIIKL